MKVAETKEEAHVYTIPLKVGKGIVRRRRANKAIKSIKEYVARHMDAKEEDVWIDAHLNEKIWGRGGAEDTVIRKSEGSEVRGRTDRGLAP